ncbi:MAG: integrase, partial [Clostridiales bacterium]|nr:integrase [Clostridiales bacterium]
METKNRKIEMEIIDEQFDLNGYEVVRGEFFAHLYEPSFTFNKNKISMN